MARQSRKYSESGIYHVILRGINREKIFEDDCEKQKLLQIFTRYFIGDFTEGQTPERTPEIEKYQGRLYAFCILDNHVHLLLKESCLGISNLMQRIGTSFASFYNRRHGRSGPVFESRYTSQPVENDRYFTNALKYIHNNPVCAGIVEKPSFYHWSSMYHYLKDSICFLMRNAVVGNLSNEEFETSMILRYEEDTLLKCKWPTRVSDMLLISIINNLCKKHGILQKNIIEHSNFFKVIAKKLLETEGATKAQIARLLGIKPYTLTKVFL